MQSLPAASRRQSRGRRDRGAAAVEMALVLPVLLFLLMGIIDFGHAYSTQIQLSAAAREGVRLAALNPEVTSVLQKTNTIDGDGAIASRITNAAGGLPAFAADCTEAPTSTKSCIYITYCPTEDNTTNSSGTATVDLKAKFTWITGISSMARLFGPAVFPGPTTIQITGVMRCSG